MHVHCRDVESRGASQGRKMHLTGLTDFGEINAELLPLSGEPVKSHVNAKLCETRCCRNVEKRKKLVLHNSILETCR